MLETSVSTVQSTTGYLTLLPISYLLPCFFVQTSLKDPEKSYRVAKLGCYALSQRMSAYDPSLLRTFSGPEDSAMDTLSLLSNVYK
jgi:hypothetical protein